MLHRRGSPALSPARQSQLLTRIRALAPGVHTVHAHFVHLADRCVVGVGHRVKPRDLVEAQEGLAASYNFV